MLVLLANEDNDLNLRRNRTILLKRWSFFAVQVSLLPVIVDNSICQCDERQFKTISFV